MVEGLGFWVDTMGFRGFGSSELGGFDRGLGPLGLCRCGVITRFKPTCYTPKLKVQNEPFEGFIFLSCVGFIT